LKLVKGFPGTSEKFGSSPSLRPASEVDNKGLRAAH
jgi:hypothetical protein